MPTSFIALQCFQCSTMQVKQQKKSSNKWSCVVCNQKQSVRKVFAQSFMAKDVRKFVQNFNMSRQLSDQKQSLSEVLETFDSPKDEQKRKRNDWTEYVDDQEEYCGKLDKEGNRTEGDDELEAMGVTEMPKALFKKPKVKDSSSNQNSAEKLLKPQFPNRSNTERHKNVHSQEWTEVEQTSCERISKMNDYTIRAEDNCSRKGPMALHPSERASKWSRLRAQIQDDHSNLSNREKRFLREPIEGMEDENNAIGEPTVWLHHTKGAVSKWSSFINEEEDDDLESRARRDSWDHRVSKRSNYELESLMNDERVEDDIHPDFL